MTLSSPTERGTLLSPEQRRKLGEVYQLILSWQPGNNKTGESSKEHQAPNHPTVSPGTPSSKDNSKGGANE